MRLVRASRRLAAAFSGLLGALLLGSAAPAHAHFLWAEVTPGPEATFRLSFGETAGERTAPELLPRIEPARATLADGRPLTLKRGDGALVATLPAGARAAGASQRWGILDRTAEGRGVFLLQYFAKGAQDAAAAGERSRVHFEILARREGNGWVATVMHGSRPERGAELTIIAPGAERPLELKTDEKGEARFTVSGSGRCAIRAMAVEEEAGEFEGKRYSLKRYYSTLTFPITATPGAAR